MTRFEARWVESRQESADIFSAAQANGFAFAGAPLTRDQVNQLTLAIAGQSTGFQKGERVAERGADVNWNAAVAQAQQFLSPTQLDALRAQAAHAQASQQATQSINTIVKPKVPAAQTDAAAALARKPTGG